jgi:polyferredoxin
VSKKKNYKNYDFKSTGRSYDDLGEDFKKLGTDIKNIYKKVDYKVPMKFKRSTNLLKYLIISAIIVLLVFTRIGIPIAILMLIAALYMSNKH